MKKLLSIFSFIGFSAISFAQTALINEDFSMGIPSSWKIVNKDNLIVDSSLQAEFPYAWNSVLDPFDTNSVNRCVGATSFFTTVGNANRWLITPAFSLADYGNILTFKAASFDPSFPDNYVLKIGTDTSDLNSFTGLVTYLAEAPYWSEHSFTIDSTYNNQTVFLAFVLTSDNGHKLFLDDIKVVTQDPVSTNNLTADKFSVYPNPTTDLINITNAFGLQKNVISLAGQVLISTDSDQINTSNLSAGIYLLQIEGKNELIKFIKN